MEDTKLQKRKLFLKIAIDKRPERSEFLIKLRKNRKQQMFNNNRQLSLKSTLTSSHPNLSLLHQRFLKSLHLPPAPLTPSSLLSVITLSPSLIDRLAGWSEVVPFLAQGMEKDFEATLGVLRVFGGHQKMAKRIFAHRELFYAVKKAVYSNMEVGEVVGRVWEEMMTKRDHALMAEALEVIRESIGRHAMEVGTQEFDMFKPPFRLLKMVIISANYSKPSLREPALLALKLIWQSADAQQINKLIELWLLNALKMLLNKIHNNEIDEMQDGTKYLTIVLEIVDTLILSGYTVADNIFNTGVFSLILQLNTDFALTETLEVKFNILNNLLHFKQLILLKYDDFWDKILACFSLSPTNSQKIWLLQLINLSFFILNNAEEKEHRWQLLEKCRKVITQGYLQKIDSLTTHPNSTISSTAKEVMEYIESAENHDEKMVIKWIGNLT
jgi:hypothetical protein